MFASVKRDKSLDVAETKLDLVTYQLSLITPCPSDMHIQVRLLSYSHLPLLLLAINAILQRPVDAVVQNHAYYDFCFFKKKTNSFIASGLAL